MCCCRRSSLATKLEAHMNSRLLLLCAAIRRERYCQGFDARGRARERERAFCEKRRADLAICELTNGADDGSTNPPCALLICALCPHTPSISRTLRAPQAAAPAAASNNEQGGGGRRAHKKAVLFAMHLRDDHHHDHHLRATPRSLTISRATPPESSIQFLQ